MNIDQIFALWNEDSEINVLDVGQEALNIPKLHNKYIQIYTKEKLLLLKLEKEYSKLNKNLYEYYSGTLDDTTRKELELLPNSRIVLKSDIPMYIESDDKIIDISLRIGVQKEKLQLLDSILRNIGNRGFQIKSYIDYQKFINGA